MLGGETEKKKENWDKERGVNKEAEGRMESIRLCQLNLPDGRHPLMGQLLHLSSRRQTFSVDPRLVMLYCC